MVLAAVVVLFIPERTRHCRRYGRQPAAHLRRVGAAHRRHPAARAGGAGHHHLFAAARPTGAGGCCAHLGVRLDRHRLRAGRPPCRACQAGVGAGGQCWLRCLRPDADLEYRGSLVPCVGWVLPVLVGCIGFGAVVLTRLGSQAYPPQLEMAAAYSASGARSEPPAPEEQTPLHHTPE